MSESKYKCKECDNELDIGLVRLQEMINASYNLKIMNNKLLKFVKECAQGERYLNALCVKYAIPQGLDDISMKATDLLKEIGKL